MSEEILSYTVTAANGETITFYVTSGGHGVCPICGDATLAKPPWDPHIAKPSFDFCPCCDNQIGWDDVVPPDAPHGTQAARWEDLRDAWRKLAGETESVHAQLRRIQISV